MHATRLLPLLLLPACAVAYPTGWEERGVRTELVSATPGVAYSAAPRSWDLASGDRIGVDVAAHSVTSGLGAYRADMRFSVAHAGATEKLDCATDPTGPDVPRTRFGCWSAAVRFWLAPDLDCPARDGGAARSLTTPACWQGEALVHGQRLRLQHGTLRSTGAPVGYIAWVDERDEAVLAANIVGELQIELFDVRPLPPAQRRALVELTVALSWWEHAAAVD